MEAASAGPPAVENWRAGGRYLSIEGRSLFLRDEGEGPALLLLHAYPTASWGFHAVWPKLIKRFRVLALDLPGSGLSDKTLGQDYSLGGLARIVSQVLSACEIERPHLLAHGYASSVAQEMMAEGQTFASAAFITAGLFPKKGRLTLMQHLMLSPLGPWLARYAPQPFAAFRRRFIGAFGPGRQPSEETIACAWSLLRLNNGLHAVPEVLIYLTERQEQADRLSAAMQAFDAPLCLIASPDDHLSGPAEVEAWRHSLPEANLIFLPAGTGHYAPLECPEEVLQAYFAFRDRYAG